MLTKMLTKPCPTVPNEATASPSPCTASPCVYTRRPLIQLDGLLEEPHTVSFDMTEIKDPRVLAPEHSFRRAFASRTISVAESPDLVEIFGGGKP